MPPKKVAGKADSKKSIKVADDKSFGMKNKKGKKQQQQIAQIKSQVMGNEKLKQKAFDDKKKAQDAKKMQKGECFVYYILDKWVPFIQYFPHLQ